MHNSCAERVKGVAAPITEEPTYDLETSRDSSVLFVELPGAKLSDISIQLPHARLLVVHAPCFCPPTDAAPRWFHRRLAPGRAPVPRRVFRLELPLVHPLTSSRRVQWLAFQDPVLFLRFPAPVSHTSPPIVATPPLRARPSTFLNGFAFHNFLHYALSAFGLLHWFSSASY